MVQDSVIRFGKMVLLSGLFVTLTVSCLTTAKIPKPKINSTFNIEGIYVSDSDNDERPFLGIKIDRGGNTQNDLNTVYESLDYLKKQLNRILTSDIEKRTQGGSMILEGDAITLYLLIPDGSSMGRSHWGRIEYNGTVLNDSTFQLEYRKYDGKRQEYRKLFKRLE